MAKDPLPRGSFTRAYVRALFIDPTMDQGTPGAVLYISALSEPSVRELWADWLPRQLGSAIGRS